MAFFVVVEPMNRMLSLTLRIALVGGCLTWALWGVDFAGLLAAVASFRLWAVALYAALSLGSMLLPGGRLRFLMAGGIAPASGVRACLMSVALNNVLPARLGEMAKALYLRREGRVSLGRALEAVFWERFFDLNTLLLLGVAVVALLGQGVALYPLLALVGCGWCVLALLRLRPGAVHALTRLLPLEGLRLFAAEVLEFLAGNLRLGFLARLSLWTLGVWAGYAVVYTVGLCLMAGLPADPVLVLTVFAVATLGYALPGAPGGMGVFEASVVLALGWFGIGRERAFAIGLTMHLLQYVPLTAAGLWSLAKSGMTLSDLRGQVRKAREEGV